MLEREREKLLINRLYTELRAHYDLQNGENHHQGHQTEHLFCLKRDEEAASGAVSLRKRIGGSMALTSPQPRRKLKQEQHQ